MPVRNTMLIWTLLLGIIALSVTIQSLLFLNWDVASLLYATRTMLAGGEYATDMFIPNPPTILYLFVPPILLSDVLHLNIVIVFKGYVYLLAALSAYLSNGLVRLYFSDATHQESTLFMLVLLFAYLVLPTYEFGNRDYLLLVFVMPYLLMTAVRLRAIAIKNPTAIYTGLLAGLGFAIKPHFIITLGLIEFYYLYCQRSLRTLLRPEALAIAGVLILYTTLLFTVHANYVYVILPFLLSTYYAAISTSLLTITVYPLTVFCLMSLMLCLVVRPTGKLQVLFNVLMVALTGFLASIYLQHTLFYYHFLPAISVSLLLVAMQVFSLNRSACVNREDLLKLAVLGLLFTGFDLHYYYNGWRYLIFYPWYFYSVMALIFAALLYIINSRISSVLSRVAFIIMSGVVSSALLLDMGYFNHSFMVVMSLMILLFVLLAAQTAKDYLKLTTMIVMVISMAYMPAMLEYDLYSAPREYKLGALNTLSTFINSRGGKQSIYVFSPAIYYAYPLVFYANAIPAQRFEQLWPVMGFAHLPKFENEQQAATYRKNKDYFISMVVEDIRKNKPDLIFIDKQNPAKAKFDYVAFFSVNPGFVQEWKSYRYLTTLHLGRINNRETDMPVYQRIP